jgi:hydrogenase-1 operon protein HyaF
MPPTGNVLPILHEIRHALHKLLDSGEATIIDLRAMPFAPGEEQELETQLGGGEVSVAIDALGPSTVKESAIPGVWLVTHYNEQEEVVGKFIEITRMPSILESQTEDIRNGLERLSESLTNNS